MAFISRTAVINAIRSVVQSVKPDAPAADHRLLYAKADGWYDQASDGTESKIGAGAPASHGNEAHTSTFITAAGVTKEALATNGDVGSGADQVAAGDHTHEGLAADASDITFTPAVSTDWDGDADPGDVDNALDQLAERVDDLESAPAGVEAHNLLSAAHADSDDADTPIEDDLLVRSAAGKWFADSFLAVFRRVGTFFGTWLGQHVGFKERLADDGITARYTFELTTPGAVPRFAVGYDADGSTFAYLGEEGGPQVSLNPTTGAAIVDELAVAADLEHTAHKGAANGYAPLDGDGKVPAANLPAAGGSGDVVGPASSTDGHLAVWDGTDSKTLKDGGAVPAGGGGFTNPMTAKGDLIAGVGLSYTNYALVSAGASVLARSSDYGDTRVAGWAIDGNDATAWASQNGAADEWLSVDLGQARKINQVRIKQYIDPACFCNKIKISHSANGTDWTDLMTHTFVALNVAGTGDETWAVTETTARYWRMWTTPDNAPGWPFGMYSFELRDASVPAGTPARFAVGTNGQFMTPDSAQTLGVKYVGTVHAHIADAKVDYTTGDLDTEAELITALNAANTKLNALIATLEAYGMALTS